MSEIEPKSALFDPDCVEIPDDSMRFLAAEFRAEFEVDDCCPFCGNLDCDGFACTRDENELFDEELDVEFAYDDWDENFDEDWEYFADEDDVWIGEFDDVGY
jgi:hypothetical protein